MSWMQMMPMSDSPISLFKDYVLAPSMSVM